MGNSETYMPVEEKAIKIQAINATELEQAQDLEIRGIYEGSQGQGQK